MHARLAVRSSLVITLVGAVAGGCGSFGWGARAPTQDEQAALVQLDTVLDGAVVYAHDGRIRKVALGTVTPLDLGPGRCARFSPDGRRLAVYHDHAVFVMDADGKDRVELMGNVEHKRGCPMVFGGRGEQVIVWKKGEGLFSIRIDTRAMRRIDVKGELGSELDASNDGSRLLAREGDKIYAVELNNKNRRRKIGSGDYLSVSPDGRWTVRGSDTVAHVEPWGKGAPFALDASVCRPERRWDNLSWSNHPNFMVAEGDRDGHFLCVVDVAAHRGTRVTWEKAAYPDLFVAEAPARDQRPTPPAPPGSPPPAPPPPDAPPPAAAPLPAVPPAGN